MRALILDAGSVAFDQAKRQLSVDGREIHLTGTESRLMELLMLRSGRVLTRDHIMDVLYGHRQQPPVDKVLDVMVCKLRDAGAPPTIGNVWGQGYIFRPTTEARA